MTLRLAAACLFFALPAHAEVPRVVTDIAPVHSLVSMVMEGVGAPELLLPPGTSAHHFALKPSQARALAEAELMVWIGPALTPALGESMANLAPQAAQLVLAEAPGTLTLPYRDLDEIGQSEQADGHDDHADHDDHEAHDDHEKHEEHEDHAEADPHEGHDHAHGGTDPHLWLTPVNARLWLTTISQALASQDPDNALTYQQNAAAAQARVDAAEAEARQSLRALENARFAVFHDAFQYYEQAFGLTVIGAISDSEAAAAGPAQLDALRDHLAEQRPACILTEPGANLKLVQAVAPDLPMVELDPMGSTLPLGSGLYPALLQDIAARLGGCAP
ncbi:zinc ABC transporter substrate-binding protein [Tropicibacter oceani]|uniref:High-affinity zinc uptake system protein ZnuA n=1 Tax=Tropicibacter oceani TaxID=3058420 RepID=A0ABY8QHK7_9RHOB|nr:zinc ABC transporter substrate-binding protein [Tropicibacter oceani]WGW03458.1 zinc ABC transporter substrate-binding protein [Tropicibacter oceani]